MMAKMLADSDEFDKLTKLAARLINIREKHIQNRVSQHLPILAFGNRERASESQQKNQYRKVSMKMEIKQSESPRLYVSRLETLYSFSALRSTLNRHPWCMKNDTGSIIDSNTQPFTACLFTAINYLNETPTPNTTMKHEPSMYQPTIRNFTFDKRICHHTTHDKL